jgi:hypothetical protein
LEEIDGSLRYKFINATDVNLREGLREKPLGVHFACHGFRNPKKSEGIKVKISKKVSNATCFYADKGDFLLFENQDGSANFFHQDDI